MAYGYSYDRANDSDSSLKYANAFTISFASTINSVSNQNGNAQCNPYAAGDANWHPNSRHDIRGNAS